MSARRSPRITTREGPVRPRMGNSKYGSSKTRNFDFIQLEFKMDEFLNPEKTQRNERGLTE